MRSEFFWKKPQPPDNVLLGRSGLTRNNFGTGTARPATVTKPKKIARVTTNAVTVPQNYFKFAPRPVTESSTVTSVTICIARVNMAVTDDSRKSPAALAQEGLVRFCVNMGNNRFVEQWVTPLVYNELLEEAVNVRVQSAADPTKDRLDALCTYCGHEFPIKLRLVDHRWRGCHEGPFVPGYSEKGEGLPVYPNLKTTALSMAIAKQVESGGKLAIRNQKGVDDDQDLTKYPSPTDTVTRQVLRLQSLRELPPGIWNKDHRREQEKPKKGGARKPARDAQRDEDGDGEGSARGKDKAKQKRKVVTKPMPRPETDVTVEHLSSDSDTNIAALAKKQRTSTSKEKNTANEGNRKKNTRKTSSAQDAIVPIENALVPVTDVTDRSIVPVTRAVDASSIPGPHDNQIGRQLVAVETQTPHPSVTSTAVDNMNDAAFTTIIRHASPSVPITEQELMLIEHVTNFDAVDAVVDNVLEDALGEGSSGEQVPQKGFHRVPPATGSKNRTKSKELLQIEQERATARARFTAEAESMVTEQFVVPSYPPPMPVAGLVELLRFMFSGYDWESDNLAGFNKRLAEYRDLTPFNGNYTVWFDNKFCAAYGAWTFYNKVSIHNPIPWLQWSCLLYFLFWLQ